MIYPLTLPASQIRHTSARISLYLSRIQPFGDRTRMSSQQELLDKLRKCVQTHPYMAELACDILDANDEIEAPPLPCAPEPALPELAKPEPCYPKPGELQSRLADAWKDPDVSSLPDKRVGKRCPMCTRRPLELPLVFDREVKSLVTSATSPKATDTSVVTAPSTPRLTALQLLAVGNAPGVSTSPPMRHRATAKEKQSITERATLSDRPFDCKPDITYRDIAVALHFMYKLAKANETEVRKLVSGGELLLLVLSDPSVRTDKQSLKGLGFACLYFEHYRDAPYSTAPTDTFTSCHMEHRHTDVSLVSAVAVVSLYARTHFRNSNTEHAWRGALVNIATDRIRREYKLNAEMPLMHPEEGRPLQEEELARLCLEDAAAAKAIHTCMYDLCIIENDPSTTVTCDILFESQCCEIIQLLCADRESIQQEFMTRARQVLLGASHAVQKARISPTKPEPLPYNKYAGITLPVSPRVKSAPAPPLVSDVKSQEPPLLGRGHAPIKTDDDELVFFSPGSFESPATDPATSKRRAELNITPPQRTKRHKPLFSSPPTDPNYYKHDLESQGIPPPSLRL